MLTQQQAACTGTVDKQITGYLAGTIGCDGFNISVCSRINLLHIRLDVFYAELIGAVLAQQLSELPGVQVITIVHDESVFRRCNLLGGQAVSKQCSLRCHSICKLRRIAQRQPMWHEVCVGEAGGDGKWVAVGISAARMPVAEESALFEAGIALSNKVSLRQSNALQGGSHGWPGAFTNPDGWHIW